MNESTGAVYRFPNGPDYPMPAEGVRITFEAGNEGLVRFRCSECGSTFSNEPKVTRGIALRHGEEAHVGETVTYGPMP